MGHGQIPAVFEENGFSGVFYHHNLRWAVGIDIIGTLHKVVEFVAFHSLYLNEVLPVNLTSMKVKEEEFSTDLNPIRATVTVSLTVIEGPNLPYQYSKAKKETMSALHLANIAEVATTIVPL